MFKKYVKTTLKSLAIFLSVIVLILLAFGIWVYTGPRSVPFLADYTAKEISGLLPESTELTLGDVLLDWEIEEKHLALKIIDIKVHDTQKGDFDISHVNLRVNPLGLVPQSNSNLLNIQIAEPKIKLTKLAKTTGTGPLPVQKINNYIKQHKAKLRKFSLSLTKTNFKFNLPNENEIDVIVNKVSIRPVIRKGNLVFILYSDISLGEKSYIADITLDTSSNKHLSAKGSVSNISSELLNQIGLSIPQLSGSHIEADMKFNALIRSTKAIDYIEFDIHNFEGVIQRNDFFPINIEPQEVAISGYCNKNCSVIEVEKLKIKDKVVDITGSFSYKPVSGQKTLSGKFSLGKMPVDKVKGYWPKTLTPRTREWIFKHISGGKLLKSEGKFNLNLDKLHKIKKLSHDDINIKINLEGSKLKYMKGAPKLKDMKDATLLVTGDDITITIGKAKMLNTKVSNLKGYIPHLGTSKSRVDVSAQLSGGVQDLVDIGYAHTDYKNATYKDLEGEADTYLDASVPFDNITFDTISLKVDSKISDFNANNVYKEFDITGGEIDAHYEKKNLSMNGHAMINSAIPVEINLTQNFNTHDRKTKIKTHSNWDEITKIGISKPDYLNNHFTAELNINEAKGKSTKTVLLDLSKSTVLFKPLGIKKKIGEQATARFTLDETKEHVEIKDYTVNIGNLESNGTGKLSTNFSDVLFISSKNTKLGKGRFGFTYKKDNKNMYLDINGYALDISQAGFNIQTVAPSGESEQAPKDKLGLIIKTKLKNIYMKNGITLTHPVFEVKCDSKRCNKIILDGGFDENTYLTLNMNYPVFSLTSNDAGKTAKAFDITTKLNKGELNLYGKYDQGVFKGNLNVEKYYMKKAPMLAQLLSISAVTANSFEGLGSLLEGKGVKFDSLTCPLQYWRKVIKLSDCVTTGPSLALTANGYINLKENSLDIKGTAVPENIINAALKNLPIIGKALGQKKEEGTIATTYTVTGTINDPKINVNPLSILAPNFLKKIFNRFDKHKIPQDFEESKGLLE